MNNFFLSLIVVLIFLSSALLFFYARDVLRVKSEASIGNCVPVNLHIKDITSTDFIVEWETLDDCLGLVKYGDSVDSMEYLAIGNDKRLAKKEHVIKVENLKPSSVYYVVIFSGEKDYGIENAPVVINTESF